MIGNSLSPPVDVENCGKLEGGHSGSIFYLDSKDKERVVVNLDTSDQEKRFQQLDNALNLLSARGVSLAKPLAPPGVISDKGDPKVYRVTEFIKGYQTNAFSIAQVKILARELAKIHATTGEFVEKYGWLNPKMNMLGQGTPANIEAKHRKAKAVVQDDPILSEVVDNAAKDLLEAAKIHHTGLPVGLRHGDFKGKNIVFKSADQPVLIDWEHLDCGILLSEIAFVLGEVAYTGNVFDKTKANAFLEAYNEIRPLRQTEVEALPQWLINSSKLHNLIRGIGMGIKYADDTAMPLPSAHSRLIMHKSLEKYAKTADFGRLTAHSTGIPREVADEYTRKPKIVIWVESRSGAGHVHRVASSAKELVHNGYEVYVATSSMEYVKQAGMDKYAHIIPLPGFLVDQPDYQGSKEEKERDAELTIYQTSPLEDEAWKKERTEILIKALQDIQPDIFVTEEYPMTRHPIYSPELEGALRFIHSKKSTLENRPLVFSMAKDIVLASNPMIKEPAGGSPETASEFVGKYYDHLFIKGDERVIPIWETAPYLAAHKDKITHVGYMAHTANVMRDPSLPDKDRNVVIATGGSFDENASSLIRKAIKARGLSNHLSHHQWSVFVANDCPADEFTEIQRLAEQEGGSGANGSPNIRVMHNGREYKAQYPNAAASVIRCGYNTVNEAVFHGVPSVVIPRPTSPEQNLRAKIFCDISNGKLQQMHSDDDEHALAAALDRAYKSRNKEVTIPEFGTDGYQQAVNRIYAMNEVKHFSAEDNFLKAVSVHTINKKGIKYYQVQMGFDDFTNMHAAAFSFHRRLSNKNERFDEDAKAWVHEGNIIVYDRNGGHSPKDSRSYHVAVYCVNHMSGAGTMFIESDNEAFANDIARSAGSYSGGIEARRQFSTPHSR